MAANPREAPRRAAPTGPANGPPPPPAPPPPPPARGQQDPRRKVVIAPADAANGGSTSWLWAILATFVSLIFHGGVIAALFYLPDTGFTDAKEKEPDRTPLVDAQD